MNFGIISKIIEACLKHCANSERDLKITIFATNEQRSCKRSKANYQSISYYEGKHAVPPLATAELHIVCK